MVKARPRVGIAGLGYMGLSTGLGFAQRGLRVQGFEIRSEVRRELRKGRTTFHEPDLPSLLRTHVENGRFSVVDDWTTLVEASDVIFLCLPTPRRPDGRIDLRPLMKGVDQLGRALKERDRRLLVVVKSTVVPGTTEGIVRPRLEETTGRGDLDLGVAANPEFLAEGSMVRDVLFPERIVVGVSSERDGSLLGEVYRGFRAPLLVLSPTGAELVKYASNAYLAMKVTFANELSRISERAGVDVDEVTRAVGLDSRIGPKFLGAGPGFGGSCFEKDVRALVVRAHELGVRPRVLESLVPSNEDQTAHAYSLVRSIVGPVRGRSLAVLGLAFKAGTDDVRETRALPLVARAARDGALVRVHDPVALVKFRDLWLKERRSSAGRVRFCSTVTEALDGADAAILHSPWPEYLSFPRDWTARMRTPIVIDLRRALPGSVRRRSDLRWVGLGTATARREQRRER